MSIDEFSPESTGSTAGQARDAARTAAQETSKVASSVGESSKQVAGEAATQASAVLGEARVQLQSLVGQAKDELGTQLSSRGEQVAGGLRRLVGQIDALADGRPGEAGALTGYLREARGKVETVARRLDEGGPQGVIGDLSDFARRRPGTFLAAAGLVGFVVGRAVRAGAAASKEGLVESGSTSARSVTAAPAGELPPPAREELVWSAAQAEPTVGAVSQATAMELP